ncbi:haloalkane dehalogenase [Rhizobium leguminosarum bv. viciae]|uniref:haloalkane dehalogenase n=1 Tax=Rhizobium leguminosarum TaxID=384 RepID=UPI0014426C20|nr:haloalkane dehalogenase [Rhizobium leguminosarum]NKJ94705.1 haloalkane dehalogenase [Rhizobium leguminosarum bv. viciae]NKK87481.1 haloalkane dehalogenase [Rhizobium leguminosarum bv. viciae]
MTQPETRRSDEPFAAKKFLDIGGHKMAYIDEGEGPAIVFQHGNPTSSYLWRNVMPHLKGHGRLIAADFIGMGDSDKLDPALGPSRYSFTEQKKYLFALWDALDLGNDVILVLHDTGSMFGFDWANQHRDRVQGIAYMESIVAPLIVSDFPDYVQEQLTYITPQIMEASLQGLDFLEGFLLKAREFSDAERAYYRAPFLTPGEDRRPMISFDLPIEGMPQHTAKIVDDYSRWLAVSKVPKLLIKANPGYLLINRLYDIAKAWPNQTEVTVDGGHYVQETAPEQVGSAISRFVRGLRVPILG